MSMRERIKYAAYRLPPRLGVMTPSYSYKVDPGELTAMISLIDASREAGGAVVEIGVAQGDTSVFLLEHLVTTDDDRRLLLFDTFAGFTPGSVSIEVGTRGKSRSSYDSFAYGDEGIFRRKLQAQGYTAFETFVGDAAAFDWSSIGPIGAVLLDIDLYAPTKATLDAIHPHLVPGGGIVVDDCRPNTAWDGSLQAYEEFISEHELPFRRVGGKGALIVKG